MNVVLLITLAVLCSVAAAEPLAQIERDSVRIVLYSEPCELKDRVINLPRRAEWTGLARVYQGCWAQSPLGLVVLFFDDLTVTVLPSSAFVEVREI